MITDEGYVADVRLNIVDPLQPNANMQRWIDIERAERLSIAAIREDPRLNAMAIEPLEYKTAFYRTSEDLTITPFYLFHYMESSWSIYVNALTGDVEIRMNGAAAVGDTQTVTCKSNNANRV